MDHRKLPRKKRNTIWFIDSYKLATVVVESKYFAEILNKFGYASSRRNYAILQLKLDNDKINYSHIKRGLDSNKGRKFKSKYKYKLYDVLSKNSKIGRAHLKKRVIKEGLLEEKCSICNLGPEWNGKKLVIQIDHINGIKNDNRIKNLRMVCPNCHSQTETFSGKNKLMEKIK